MSILDCRGPVCPESVMRRRDWLISGKERHGLLKSGRGGGATGMPGMVTSLHRADRVIRP
ncbi:MAG: hypothetical protein J1E80_08160 [Desulfovibrionaceae bacterium]|nr:hypothetical protein [Desulfovibrionaceae bacterium]